MSKSVEYWLNQDNLIEATAQVQREVSASPNDEALQFLLFELLALSENFNESENALVAAAKINPALSKMFEIYRGLLNAERIRYNIMMKGEGDLSVLTELPTYSAKFILLIKLISQGKLDEAEVLIKKTYQEVPKVSGEVDGVKFLGIRDSNDLIYPFLEVLTPNHYFWVPFSHIHRIEFRKLAGYQNTIWIPTYLEIKKMTKIQVWLPSLYSGTGVKEDILKLGRMTTWDNISDSINRAYGQRDFMFVDNNGSSWLKGIHQISSINFDVSIRDE